MTEPNDPIVDPDGVSWTFDHDFLQSNWTCIWDRGCAGIEAHAAPIAQLGCCSQGAELHDDDELRTIAALAALLEPEEFQFHAEAAAGGIVADDRNEYDRQQTRRVDGACIFLNRPGFTGGAGCALHRGATEFDEPPMDWKPSVCWQLPLRIDWTEVDADTETATVRRWTRADWSKHGETMAWCCTERSEGGEAYCGDESVVVSMRDELTALAGDEVYVELTRRLAD